MNLDPETSIAGRRVMLVGKLASMPRRDAEDLLRAHGGVLVDRVSDGPQVVVTCDEASELQRLAASDDVLANYLREGLTTGDVEVIGESMLWSRLGFVDSNEGVARLYTAAMLAELVRVPTAAVRQWHRRWLLRAKREVRRLAYFDFEEVPVARKLAQLFAAGCTTRVMNRKLESLARLLPEVERPLADPAVVVEGRRLFVRRDDGLTEPSGQLVMEFGSAGSGTELDSDEARPATISMLGPGGLHKQIVDPQGASSMMDEDLRGLSAELQAAGHVAEAVEAYRAVMFGGDVTADDQFALAELLYQTGDLAAARERYYMAIEMDEDFVEARSNLGCVLGELGETNLAEAAFRGALEYHPDYADAHYHLARLLERHDRPGEAASHWRLFMSLAPESPWAVEARERMEEGYRLSAVSLVNRSE